MEIPHANKYTRTNRPYLQRQAAGRRPGRNSSVNRDTGFQLPKEVVMVGAGIAALLVLALLFR